MLSVFSASLRLGGDVVFSFSLTRVKQVLAPIYIDILKSHRMPPEFSTAV